MMKAVIDQDIPFIKGIIEQYACVGYLRGDLIDNRAVRDAELLIVRTRTYCGERLLEGTKVRTIATATIGTDHIDMDYCIRKGINVIDAAGCNARAVLQWVGAALVLDSRRHGWNPRLKTIGIVGTGNVGSLIKRYCGIWGFNVICCDPPLKEKFPDEFTDYVDFGQIAEYSDIITFHTPLENAGPYPTYGMGGRAFFTSVKDHAVIINTSRGEVLDSEHLFASLDDGKRRYIDTWPKEPRPDPRLIRKADISTMHIAGYSMQGKANATSIIIEKLSRIYGWPYKNWYPSGVPRVQPRDISWGELCSTVENYLNLEAVSDTLKAKPESFENLRAGYRLREEYF